MKKTTSFALSAACLLASFSFAKDAPKANPFTELLAPVPAAEMPAKAADVVRLAKSRERAATTSDVVRAALGINPAAAPAVVGAIASSVPAMASVAAGAAAAEQPKQAAAIAKAGAAAAPSQVGKIVLPICRVVPNEYYNTAVAASQAVPGANKAILKAVGAALPDLKPYIEQALITYGGNVPSVSTVLNEARKLAQANAGSRISSSAVRTPASGPAVAAGQPAAAPATPAPGTSLARGPAVGPPYIPLTSTPTNVTSGTSGQVPTGGRNYAAP
jgi:hypothetical protein